MNRLISLEVVVTILIQTAVFAAWMGSHVSETNERIRSLEMWREDNGDIRERIAVIEQQTIQIAEAVERIEKNIRGIR